MGDGLAVSDMATGEGESLGEGDGSGVVVGVGAAAEKLQATRDNTTWMEMSAPTRKCRDLWYGGIISHPNGTGSPPDRRNKLLHFRPARRR